jgi:hypothetical protein
LIIEKALRNMDMPLNSPTDQEASIVILAGREWSLPAISSLQLLAIMPFAVKLAGITSDTTTAEQRHAILQIFHITLSRAYPDLTYEQFLELPIGLDELMAAGAHHHRDGVGGHEVAGGGLGRGTPGVCGAPQGAGKRSRQSAADWPPREPGASAAEIDCPPWISSRLTPDGGNRYSRPCWRTLTCRPTICCNCFNRSSFGAAISCGGRMGTSSLWQVCNGMRALFACSTIPVSVGSGPGYDDPPHRRVGSCVMHVLKGGRKRIFAGLTAKPTPKVSDRFYLTAAWQNLVECEIKRRFGSAENAWCERTECLGPIGTRVFGVHILELADGGQPLDPRNLQFLCGSCRTRKSNTALAARLGHSLMS